MTNSAKSIFKNFGFSFTSNAVSVLISALVIAVVPKLITVADYGYYQLYIFYAAYTGFFHFGWVDGIYLKYGGIHYEDYEKPLINGQFWSLAAFEAAVTALLSGAVLLLVPEVDRQFVLLLTAVSILFVIPRTMLSYLLQISNRIREYSLVVIVEKLAYLLLTFALLLLGVRSYRPLVAADVAGKAASMVLGMYYCRDIIFCGKFTALARTVKEAWENTCIGIKLMIANVASMLILGIVRMCIENRWDIETYAKVSLAISVSSMLMVFINAVGIVLFPILKRIDRERMREIYVKIRDVLMVVLLGMMFVYYPAQWLLSRWLPDYAESFVYMSILFPMCIYESKMSLLINTYFKALRKERELLLANVLTVVLSAALSGLCVYVLSSITLSMVSVVVLFAFRCLFCETILARELGLSFVGDSLAELAVCALFMLCSTQLSLLPALCAYAVVYAAYLYYKKETLHNFLDILKKLLHR